LHRSVCFAGFTDSFAAICAELITWRPISEIDDDSCSVPDDTVCTFTEVSSAADATADTSALERSAVADMLSAVVCMELADVLSPSNAACTVASNSISTRKARSALAAFPRSPQRLQ